MIEFFAAGIPQPKGSAKGFGFIRKSGPRAGRIGVSITNDAGPKAKVWASMITDAAMEVYSGAPLTGPVRVDVTFFMPRPKGHFRKDGSVRPSAPSLPTTKPDLDKLTRNAMDALKGVILADDSIITDRRERKRYATGSAGAQFVISPQEIDR